MATARWFGPITTKHVYLSSPLETVSICLSDDAQLHFPPKCLVAGKPSFMKACACFRVPVLHVRMLTSQVALHSGHRGHGTLQFLF